MIYDNCKIYGPYLRKDQRMHVIIIFPEGRRTTVSYPKYLMECHLNRFLDKNETIDHIDGNFNNNAFDNLRIMDLKIHVINDVKRKKSMGFICPICNKSFNASGSKLHDIISNINRKKAGPFCSKECAGKYGRMIQLNQIKPLEIINIIPEYTTNKLQSEQSESKEQI